MSYSIGGMVAQGGMGAILDARQRAIDRTVAMKVMLETGDEADVLRFIDEAKITGQLDHPNIVPIYELGVDEQGQLFYTMKMVRGITLKKVLELLAAADAETVEKYPLPALLTIYAVVRQAMAFDKAARYPGVEALQTDLLAYQNGFATSAEKAGAWKQITAPALRQLADTEAGFQRFDSALEKLDASARPANSPRSPPACDSAPSKARLVEKEDGGPMLPGPPAQTRVSLLEPFFHRLRIAFIQ